MEYVQLTSKQVANLDKVTVGENKSIFTKIKKYPYEFEINSSLQLTSIDGVNIADSEDSKFSEEEIKSLIKDEIQKYMNIQSNTIGYIDTSNLLTFFTLTETQNSYTATENCFITATLNTYNFTSINISIQNYQNNGSMAIVIPYNPYLAKGDTIKFTSTNYYGGSIINVWKVK